ncbi:unnamed protein product [Orchesella dallaii]|uniref:Calcium channel flower n=1 Tax=Orchesella dallaii TaxID=48710 RepID=A0ABP1S4M9_9HEXA
MQSPTGMGGEYGAGGEVPKEEQPWYVKYGLRALGTAAGGLAMFFGLFNLIFSVFSPLCIVLSVWQILCGFLVVTIESPCCCVFVEHVNKVTEIVERKPMWMKAAAYVIAPIPAIIFCFGANTFLGGGSIVGTGVVYGMVALGKKATREEMARNAQTVFPGTTKNPYEPQVDQPRAPAPTRLTPTSPSYADPIQASAAQWATQSTVNFEPPPAYNATSSIPTSPTRAAGWDTTFLNDGSNPATIHSTAISSNTSVHPAPNNPYDNPFQ